MTFRLTIGDKLMRDERNPSAKSGSDLVRDFRKKLRAEAQAEQTQAAARRPSGITFLDRGRSPRMSRP